jgi:hypothetical protein
LGIYTRGPDYAAFFPLYRGKAEGVGGGVIAWERIEPITPGRRKLHLKDVVVNVPNHRSPVEPDGIGDKLF